MRRSHGKVRRVPLKIGSTTNLPSPSPATRWYGHRVVEPGSSEDVAVRDTPTASEQPASQFSPPIPFQFTGTAGEYFRIWAVNLLLSIVTLGLYSPWAKVRRMQYFYGSTSVNGASFTYHASPIAILKGRLLTYGALIIAVAIGYFAPGVGQVLSILLALCWPAVIVKALRFRNSNSAYRGIRFGFDGDYRDAYRVFLWLGALMLPTLGLIYPYIVSEQQKFIANNTRYGSSPFRFELTIGPFVQIFVRGVSLFIALAVVAAVLSIGAMIALGIVMEALGTPIVPSDDPEAVTTAEAIVSMVPFVLMVGAMGTVYVYFQTAVKNLVWNNLSLVERDVIDYVFWGRPDVEEVARFASTLKARRLLWIYITNWAGIVATVGLAVPWARIRLARYRAECMYLFYQPALDRVVAAQADAVAATGSEFAEAVDFDIGL